MNLEIQFGNILNFLIMKFMGLKKNISLLLLVLDFDYLNVC